MNDKWIIRFTVLADYDADTPTIESGFCIAADLAEAAKQIEEGYGSSLLEIKTLRYIAEGSFLYAAPEAVDKFEEEINNV